MYCVLTVTEVQCSEADVARSLLFTISNDIGQIACLYAMMHQLNKVSLLIHLVYQDSDSFSFKLNADKIVQVIIPFPKLYFCL